MNIKQWQEFIERKLKTTSHIQAAQLARIFLRNQEEK